MKRISRKILGKGQLTAVLSGGGEKSRACIIAIISYLIVKYHNYTETISGGEGLGPDTAESRV